MLMWETQHVSLNKSLREHRKKLQQVGVGVSQQDASKQITATAIIFRK